MRDESAIASTGCTHAKAVEVASAIAIMRVLSTSPSLEWIHAQSDRQQIALALWWVCAYVSHTQAFALYYLVNHIQQYRFLCALVVVSCRFLLNDNNWLFPVLISRLLSIHLLFSPFLVFPAGLFTARHQKGVGGALMSGRACPVCGLLTAHTSHWTR